MNNKQYSFSELSKKMVVNVADGKELGHACDLIFNSCGNVLGLVVPGKKSLFKSITSADTIFIPFNRIVRIGSDVILVEMIQSVGALSQNKQEQPCGNGVYTQEAQDNYAETPQSGENAAREPQYATQQAAQQVSPSQQSAVKPQYPASYPQNYSQGYPQNSSPDAQTFYH